MLISYLIYVLSSAFFVLQVQGQLLGTSGGSSEPPMPGHAEVLLQAMEVSKYNNTKNNIPIVVYNIYSSIGHNKAMGP